GREGFAPGGLLEPPPEKRCRASFDRNSSVSFVYLAQMFAHESLGAKKLGLDRVDGDAASLGDLSVGELFDVAEDQDHPRLRRKLAQGAVDVDPLRAGSLPRGHVGRFRDVTETAPLAPLVDADVRQDAVEPRRGSPFVTIVGGMAKDAQESRLHRILRLAVIAEHSAGDRVEAVLVATDEHDERLLAPGGDARDQLGLVPLPRIAGAHHCGSCWNHAASSRSSRSTPMGGACLVSPRKTTSPAAARVKIVAAASCSGKGKSLGDASEVPIQSTSCSASIMGF